MMDNNSIVFFKAATLAALMALGTGSAMAQSADLRQPINIDADQAEVDYKANISRYSGNVVLTQGSIKVRASNVELSRSGQRINTKLTGQPATYQQTLDNGTPVSASANQIIYGAESGIIELSGNARITRGADVVAAQDIRYNIATGRTVGSGRVSVTITPPPTSQ